jgi:hypothetical protein
MSPVPPRPTSDVPQRRPRPVVPDHRRNGARESALWVSGLAVVIAPGWSGFDLLLEPQAVRAFLVVRLVSVVRMLVALWVLWRRPWDAAGPSCWPAPRWPPCRSRSPG